MHKVAFSDCHYLRQNSTDEAWGTAITTTGYQDIPSGADYPSRTEHPLGYYFKQKAGRVLNEYQIIYVTRGKGIFCSRSAGKMYLHAGDVFLLFPGEWHVYMPDAKTGWATYWIGFKGSYPDSLHDKGFFHKAAPVYNTGLNETLVSLFRQVIDYSRNESPAYHHVLAGMAIHLLAQVYAINHTNKSHDATEQVITKAKIIMLQNIHEQFSPERVAESLNISYSLFRSLFKQHTGMAPGQYQQQLRIQKAKELLMDFSKTVREISIMMNFDSDCYFSTFFRQRTGVTPSTFRKHALNGILGKGR